MNLGIPMDFQSLSKAMMHENAYVASVSLSADVNQTVKDRETAKLAMFGPELLMAIGKQCLVGGLKHEFYFP